MISGIIGAMLRSLFEEDTSYVVVYMLFLFCITGAMLLYDIPTSDFWFNFGFDVLCSIMISASLTMLVGYKKLEEIFERERQKEKEAKNDLSEMQK